MQDCMHYTRHQTAVRQTQDHDYPGRMLYYALIGSIFSWTIVGALGWGVWKLVA